MKKSVLLRKPNEMLLPIGMNLKIQTNIYNQSRFSFKILIMFFNGNF